MPVEPVLISLTDAVLGLDYAHLTLSESRPSLTLEQDNHLGDICLCEPFLLPMRIPKLGLLVPSISFDVDLLLLGESIDEGLCTVGGAARSCGILPFYAVLT